MEHGVGYCDITCDAYQSFRTWSDAEVASAVALLREADQRARDGLLSKAKCEELQLACGLNFNASGLLASARLMSHCSLIGCVTYDWVHSALQDGCFVIEASLVVKACEDHAEATCKGLCQNHAQARCFWGGGTAAHGGSTFWRLRRRRLTCVGGVAASQGGVAAST